MEWTHCLSLIGIIISTFIQERIAQDCDMNGIAQCASMMSKLASATGDTSETCKASAEIESCLLPYKEVCSANKDSNAYKMYSQSLAAIAGFKALCKCYPAWQCTMGMQTPSVDSAQNMADICKNYTTAKTCMMPYEDVCKDDQTTQNIKKSFQNLEAMCNKDKCNIMKLDTCNRNYERLGEMNGIFRPEMLCKGKDMYRNCAEPTRKACAGHMEKSYMMSVRQSDMIYEILDLICVKEQKALMESIACFSRDDVALNMDSCGELSRPTTDENGQFMMETEEAQCSRMSKMRDCLATSVKEHCDEKAGQSAVRIGESFLRIMYNAENLKCEINGSNKIPGVSVLVALLSFLACRVLW